MTPPGEHPDDLLAAALATGKTWEAAAELANVSKSTVKRRMREAGFRARVAEFRREAVLRTLGALTEAMPDAAATLHAVAKDKEARERVRAAQLVIELGVKLRTSEDHEDRIARLEERFGGDERDQDQQAGTIGPGGDAGGGGPGAEPDH